MKTNEKEIKKLKKEAKKYYLAYYKVADNYDCGLNLAENISSDLLYCKNEFNRVMNKLAELDPDTPKARL